MTKLLTILLAALLAIGAAGCGDGGGGDAKKGGTLTVVDTAGGIDSLDPGYWYYQTDYQELGQTTHRWLYAWKPEDTQPSPDLAEGPPKLSDGGKTITIKIKSGIKYSPPLQERTVKSADIKYAMERCFMPRVGNGYAPVYFSGIEGAKDALDGKTEEVSGIQAPDETTLVIKTDKPAGVLTTANGLALPCTIPVPKEYAKKYDKGEQSTYGKHQVFTGPYMIKGAEKGTIGKDGYQPGKSLRLVRNPSWQKATDFRPAYLDRINVDVGTNATAASRKILSGKSMVNGDFAAPPTPILKQALQSRKDQLEIGPSQGFRYIALNTKVKPLDDVNVRRALAAVTDRTALRLTRGGETLGPLATHMIPPDVPGHEEAGGAQGPGDDFYKSPTGDVELAKEYMRKAGYKSGMYEGKPLLVVADNEDPASKTAQAWQSQVAKIGFDVNLRLVPHNAVIGKFCGTPKSAVAICPTLGWGKDFFDAQSLLDPLLHSENITPSGNVNVAQSDDPQLDAALSKARTLTDQGARAKAYAEIDRRATSQVYYIVWLWDNEVNFASDNVKIARSKFNTTHDLTFTSLK